MGQQSLAAKRRKRRKTGRLKVRDAMLCDKPGDTWCWKCGERLTYDPASGQLLPTYNVYMGHTCRVAKETGLWACEAVGAENRNRLVPESVFLSKG